MVRRCQHCGCPLGPHGRLFCSPAHRKRAWRRRHRGIPENAYPAGAPGRGRVPLGHLTRTEERELLHTLAAELRASRDQLAGSGASVYERRGLRTIE
jgi:hypothetical protein